jgi:hypothetical protein
MERDENNAKRFFIDIIYLHFLPVAWKCQATVRFPAFPNALTCKPAAAFCFCPLSVVFVPFYGVTPDTTSSMERPDADQGERRQASASLSALRRPDILHACFLGREFPDLGSLGLGTYLQAVPLHGPFDRRPGGRSQARELAVTDECGRQATKRKPPLPDRGTAQSIVMAVG